MIANYNHTNHDVIENIKLMKSFTVHLQNLTLCSLIYSTHGVSHGVDLWVENLTNQVSFVEKFEFLVLLFL